MTSAHPLRFLCAWTLMLCLLSGAILSSPAMSQVLVDDRHFEFEPSADQSLPPGWGRSVSSGGPHTIEIDRLQTPHGGASLRFANQADGAKFPRIYRRFELEAGQTYHLLTRVRSTTGKAIVSFNPAESSWYGRSIDAMRAGVSGSGQWQTIQWTYTPPTTAQYSLIFTLVTPNREPADLWIDQVTVRVREFDQVAPRLVLDTRLTANHQPQATIIYPADQPDYQAMAKRIAAAVKQKTGVTLSMATDQQATAREHPVLLEAFRGQNLILLGRLDNNRAMWPIYNRFKTAIDAYYPGGDGHVLRTATSALSPGRHVIVAGGSSDAGAARAVDRLIQIIQTQDHTASDEAFALPWLLDVQLDGPCAAVFARDQRRQLARDFIEAGHDGNLSRRFYENVMSWYWSGQQAYLDLALRYLEHILDNPVDSKLPRIPAGHYGVEFFVRAYRMIDESGLLSTEQVAAVDQLIANTFRYFGGGREAGYRTAFDQPLYQLGTSDHPNASWLADKVLADFVLERIPESADTVQLRQAARHRRDTYMRVFDYLIANRWRGCGKGYAHTDVATRSLFRYALEMERYDAFVDTGNAHLAAMYHLARTGNRGEDIGLAFGTTAGITEFRLMLGVVASYTRDPQLAGLVHQMPKVGRVHYGVYVNGVHAYTPPPPADDSGNPPLAHSDLTSMPPAALLKQGSRFPVGAWALPMVPDHHRQSNEAGQQAGVIVPDLDKSFDLLNIRGGYREQDDDLLLTGGNTLPAGSLLRVVLQGVPWLLHTPIDARYDQNTVQIQALDQPGLDTPAQTPLAQLDRLASTESAAWVELTLPGYAQTDWQRRVVWLKDRLVVVQDRITARERGQYLITANWRPNGGALNDDRWVITADGRRFDMISPSRVLHVQDAEVEDNTLETRMTYRQRRLDTLQAGESIDMANVMIVQSASHTGQAEVRKLPDNAILVRTGQADEAFYYVGPLPRHLGRTDAAGVILTNEQITVFNARKLTIRDHVLLDEQQPVTMTLDLSDTPAGQVELSRLWPDDVAAATTAADQREGLDHRPARQLWRFTGAQQPGLIRPHRDGPAIQSPQQIDRNTWDLGRSAALAKIASRSGSLPNRIETSMDGQSWQPLTGHVENIPAPQVFNYGRVVLDDQAYQTLTPATAPLARYVRAVTGNTLRSDDLLFYDANQPGGLEPLTITVADLDGNGQPNIVVHPDIWPGFRGQVQTHARHEIFALRADGELRWSRLIDHRLLFVRALDWLGTGGKQLFVGAVDNHIYVLSPDGDQTHALTAGNSGQHHGHPLANAVGLWQPDPAGRRKVVIPRYHAHSFLHRDGSVEGSARNRSGYWTTDVLPYGIDFTGDGVEDTVSMNSLALLPITQQSVSDSTTLTQGGATGIVRLPRSHATLSGSRTLAFELYEPDQPRLFVARRNMMGIYDLAAEQWTLTWTPAVPLGAVATLPTRREVVAFSRDGLLWWITLSESLEHRSVTRIACPLDIRSLAVLDASQGQLLAATDQGLVQLDSSGHMTLLAAGDFRQVRLLSHLPQRRAVVVDALSVIECYAID